MNCESELLDLVSDEDLERVHGNANFGPSISKRDVLKFGVLKVASGYYQGSTSRSILLEHELITNDYQLTAKGKRYLWCAFCENSRF